MSWKFHGPGFLLDSRRFRAITSEVRRKLKGLGLFLEFAIMRCDEFGKQGNLVVAEVKHFACGGMKREAVNGWSDDVVGSSKVTARGDVR
jgi:hypothetical protein